MLPNRATDRGHWKAGIVRCVLYLSRSMLIVYVSTVHYWAVDTQTCGARTRTKGSLWLMQLFALITCIRGSTSLEGSAPRWSLTLTPPEVTASYPSICQTNTWTRSKSGAQHARVRFLSHLCKFPSMLQSYASAGLGREVSVQTTVLALRARVCVCSWSSQEICQASVPAD